MKSMAQPSWKVTIPLLAVLASVCSSASSKTPEEPSNRQATGSKDIGAVSDIHSQPAVPSSSVPKRVEPVLTAPAAQSNTPMPMDEAGKKLAMELQMVLSNAVEPMEQTRILVTANKSGRKELAPTIIEIAKACARDPKRTRQALCALSVAAKLADIHKELLAYAADFEANPSLAYCALMVLGENPEDERTLEIVNKIPKDTKDELLRAAVTEVLRVRHFAKELALLQDVREKADWLVASSTLGGVESDYLNRHPYKAFMRHELVRFSEQHPEAVAQALIKYKRFHDKTGKRNLSVENQEFRRKVAAMLSEKARAEYERLAAMDTHE